MKAIVTTTVTILGETGDEVATVSLTDTKDIEGNPRFAETEVASVLGRLGVRTLKTLGEAVR